MQSSNQAQQILVVENQTVPGQSLSAMLVAQNSVARTMVVRSCSSKDHALQLIAEAPPDVVIIDSKLTEPASSELLGQIVAMNSDKAYIGTVFLVPEGNALALNQALNIGADEFCYHERTASELHARISLVVKTKSNLDSLKRANEKLRLANEHLAKISITDELTGLYNMRYFKKRLTQEFTRAQRYDKFLSIIMFDIDHFKRVNDTNDHLMGSFVLSEIGKLVAQEIRTVDIAARFGGDEFVIMLPETGSNGAWNAATRIASRIKLRVFEQGGNKFQVTISAGIASYGPGSQNFENGTELMRRADQYLYEAKETGRDRNIDLDHSTRIPPI